MSTLEEGAKKEVSVREGCSAAASLLIGIPAGVVLQIIAAFYLWQWFVVPLDVSLEPVHAWYMLGLYMLFRLFFPKKEEKVKPTNTENIAALWRPAYRASWALAFGYLYHYAILHQW